MGEKGAAILTIQLATFFRPSLSLPLFKKEPNQGLTQVRFKKVRCILGGNFES